MRKINWDIGVLFIPLFTCGLSCAEKASQPDLPSRYIFDEDERRLLERWLICWEGI